MGQLIAFIQTIIALQLIFMMVAAEKLPECTSETCLLPDCRCANTSIPNGLPKDSIPQFIMISFDGTNNKLSFGRLKKIFSEKRKNPNGCRIRGTFFVNHEWNDYWMTNFLYSEGHEIAVHTVTHESMQAFKKAKLDRWTKEVGGMKKMLEIFGGIPAKDIKGFRAPFLRPGGDYMFEALNRSGITYDSSLITAQNMPPMWPYTLEFNSSQKCQVGSCPRNSYPAVWEVPVIHQIDASKPPRVCSMLDSCQDQKTKRSALNMLVDNFMRHYTTNRAPFPIFMRTWFSGADYRFEALQEFLEFTQLLPDVYVVPINDVIQWIQNPIACEVPGESCPLEAMGEWSCSNKDVAARSLACSSEEKRVCTSKRKVWGSSQERRLTTCQSCPKKFPWLGNPDGDLFLAKGEKIEESDKQFWDPPRGVNLTKTEPTSESASKKMDPVALVKLYLCQKLHSQPGSNLARVLCGLG